MGSDHQSGPDGKANTPDDFPVASFSRDIAEQAVKTSFLSPLILTSERDTGAIDGLVTDPTGAVISNASVIATLRQTGQNSLGSRAPTAPTSFATSRLAHMT